MPLKMDVRFAPSEKVTERVQQKKKIAGVGDEPSEVIELAFNTRLFHQVVVELSKEAFA